MSGGAFQSRKNGNFLEGQGLSVSVILSMLNLSFLQHIRKGLFYRLLGIQMWGSGEAPPSSR